MKQVVAFISEYFLFLYRIGLINLLIQRIKLLRCIRAAWCSLQKIYTQNIIAPFLTVQLNDFDSYV